MKRPRGDLDADAAEARQAVLGDVATDGRLVLELVGALEGEAAGTVEEGAERAGVTVQLVSRDALGEEALREVELLQGLVRVEGGCGERRLEEDDEEEGDGEAAGGGSGRDSRLHHFVDADGQVCLFRGQFCWDLLLERSAS